ncbi:MAG: DNA polymerase III subunit gamma/tau [Opitutales bacterium]|nr:DNA polymerase III subunit gamma/tau [Opitutales bacterium]
MPTTLSEQSPSQLVDRAIQENRLAHALLIHGQNLKQVEEFARELACKLMKIDLSENLEEALVRHPDVFFLRPSKKSRIISVADTRELIRKIQHSPQRGDRKVAFIFEVDRLNASAANAFLKTLEEPPLNTTILLLTTRPHSLLATIRSRCQLFRLPTSVQTFDDERAIAWLDSYRAWLSDLLEKRPGGKTSVPSYVIGLYGLVKRFRHTIESITKETWKTLSKQLPDDLADDERIAMESRISISLRQDFLAAIETTTEDFARGILPEHPDAANKLVDSVQVLEDATGLLRLNMKAEAMLESFLLQSLRIWSS